MAAGLFSCKHRRSASGLKEAVSRDLESRVALSIEPLVFAEAVRFCGENRFVTAKELGDVFGQSRSGTYWISDDLLIDNQTGQVSASSFDLKKAQRYQHTISFAAPLTAFAACMKGRRDGLQKTQLTILKGLQTVSPSP